MCRRGPWKTFLAAHCDGLAAAGSFTVEVLTLGSLVRYGRQYAGPTGRIADPMLDEPDDVGRAHYRY